MAKYTVNYNCGHTGTVELFGKTKIRYEKIEWMERNQICPDCYQAAKDAERAAQNKIAAEKNQGLVELVGTPKQVAWAETIRAEKLANAETLLEKAEQFIANGENLDSARIVKATTEEWMNQPSASWWIDHRNRSLEDTIRERYAKVQSVI